MVVPRSVAREGFFDSGLDGFTEEGYLKVYQDLKLRAIEDKWVES